MAPLASEPAPLRIGIDLGGTKSEVIALDPGGETLFRRRMPTPADDYPAILETLCQLVAEAEACAGRRGRIGMATPGAVSQGTGLLKNSNTVVLNGQRPDLDLAEQLGREVRLENDANCFALSEAADGAGSQAKVVFGVILGTGVGGGLIVDRHILHGRNRIAGEWGHNPLPWPRAEELPGPPCYCGRRGCIETFLSGPGLARDFEARTGTRSSAGQIVGAARDGSAPAQASVAAYLDRLARGLATVVNVLDPDVIVLGGGLSNIDELYRELPNRLSRYTFSDTLDTPIVPAVHGDSSGVRGAAWLA
jgi:fructokinase